MKKILSLAASLLILVVPVFAGGPQIGKKAPSFSLTDIDGNTRSLEEFKGKHVVLEWTNPGCPFVKKHYDSGNMQALQKEWTGKEVIWLSVCSSAEGKQGHMTPAEWREWAEKEKASPTAVLLDPDGKVGKRYEAKTTPHMFVIDPKGTLIYMGAIDDKPSYDPADVKGAANHVSLALEASLAGKPVEVSSTRPYGCSVKYK